MTDESMRSALIDALPRLRRVAVHLAPPGVDADDLVQDCLERAWRARGSFRGDAQPLTWLHRILLNRARDLASRAGPPGGHDDLDAVAEEDLRDFAASDAAAVLEQATDRSRVRAALSRLSPDDRMVLVLHDCEGWPVREIAPLGPASEAAVHKRLQRARLRLARRLADPPQDRPYTSAACRDAREHVGAYLADELAPGLRAEVDRHLRECERCPPLVQALIGLRAGLAAQRGDAAAVPPRLHVFLRSLGAADDG